MTVRTGQIITADFTTSRFDTGDATVADSLPTGTLVVNGTDDAASVTITSKTGGKYKASVTLPTLALGDICQLRIAATVNSVSGVGVIWSDSKDLIIDSNGKAPATIASGDIAAGAITEIQDGLSTYDGSDTSGTTTLLSRLSSARAGYLDNINVGGSVASQADIDALNQSASRRIILVTVPQYERPESSSNTYIVEARLYSADGAAVNADSTPTLTATGIVSGDLSANLAAATNPATGVYRWVYTVSNNAMLEQIRLDISAIISASTFTLTAYTQTTDYVSTLWTSTDATHLTAIYNKLPAGDIADQTTSEAIESQTDQLTFDGDNVLADMRAIASADTAVDTGTVGVVSFISNAYVATSGGTVNANVVEVDGENVISDGNGRIGIDTTEPMILHSDYDAAKTSVSQESIDTITNRIGSFTGTGLNTILGFLKAIMSKASNITPSDVGGTYNNTSHSLEAIREVVSGVETIGPIAITIEVLDSDDVPVTGAVVYLLINSSIYHAITDDDGVVIISPAEGAGTYNVRINSGSRYHFSPVNLTVSTDVTVTYNLVSEALTPSNSPKVTGYLYALDTEGLPVPNITHYVELVELPRGDVGNSYNEPVRTEVSDADGLVQFFDLTPHATYTVWVNEAKKTSFIAQRTNFRIASCRS